MSIDLNDLFDQVEGESRVPYRHPFHAPYADPDKMTDSQKIAWDYLIEHEDLAPAIAMIAAKGSGKTHFGSAFAFHMGQKYPGSVGCLISNSYQQATDNGGDLLDRMADQLGYPIEFFTNKKIYGRSISSLFVVDLDGTGYNSGLLFYVLVRSMDAIKKIEGIEIDWLWVEEIQDSPQDAFIKVNSRIRGPRSPNCKFIAGMTDDDFHYQYKILPRIGCLEKEKRDNGEKVFSKNPHTGDTIELYGIMLEPNIFENQKNLPATYIPNLYQTYDPEMVERYIYARRTSLAGNKVCYNYKDYLHRLGRMSQLSCNYAEWDQIILSWDFNYANMHATLWQKKPWNKEWNSDKILLHDNGQISVENDDGSIENYHSIESYASPNMEILAQIDEFELLQGGTEQMCRKILQKYGNHKGGWAIMGDASGNQQRSSSSTTDWAIIEKWFLKFPSVNVIRGLVANYDSSKGTVKYSNPDVQNTINNLNNILYDSFGVPHICFLPKSRFRRGGAAKSVAAMQRKETGEVDKSIDRSEDKDQPYSHYFDTVRYVTWFWRGNESLYTPEEFSHMVDNIDTHVRLDERKFDSKGSFIHDKRDDDSDIIGFGRVSGGLF